MSNSKPQNLQNHARFDPPFHFFLAWVFLANVVVSIVFAAYHLCFYSVWLVVLAIAALIAVFRIRIYPLKVQDRVIRLEERLRLAALLSADDLAQSHALTESQLIGLRFASDGELPALVARTLKENLTQGQIKEAIVTWRPDTFRV